ncbi:hypothetical protein GCM10023144_26940 [Pigmentiphaga soli]|uniref:Prepilin type IV endopeptidase peptidase domain-containing protein n=1 Tax=Pigmentiphaga soli TaxID=1007095 RepID=A0ABP8H5D2_9BURK
MPAVAILGAGWSATLFVALCLAVFVFDMLARRVPNWLVGLAMMGNCVALLENYPASQALANDWAAAVTGLAVGFALFLPFYLFRAMGAGDVKFFAALGFFLGAGLLLPIWIIGSVLAGIHALAGTLLAVRTNSVSPQGYLLNLAEFHVRQWKWFGAAEGYLARKRNGRSGIPYAAYLAVAALLCVAFGR